MARIDKRYDTHGRLEWACGEARDISQDDDLCNIRCGDAYFRIAGEAGRWFGHLLPQHLATEMIEGPQQPEKMRERMRALFSHLPPYESWRFVLIAVEGQSPNYTWLAKEINGDQLLEVAVNPNANEEIDQEAE